MNLLKTLFVFVFFHYTALALKYYSLQFGCIHMIVKNVNI